MRNRFRRIVGSRVGQLLAVLGVCFALLELVRLPVYQPQFVSCTPAGEEIFTISACLVTKPIWVVAIGVLYIPSMLLTSALTTLLGYTFSLSCTPTARLEFFVFLACSLTQWWLVGHGVERLFKRKALRK